MNSIITEPILSVQCFLGITRTFKKEKRVKDFDIQALASPFVVNEK
jgi:hypothetical protein